MHTYMHIHAHIYAHAYIHIYTHIHTHAHTHTHHTYTHHTYTHNTYTHNTYTHYMYTHHTYTHLTYTHTTRTHTIHAQTYTHHIHTHAHTPHTQARALYKGMASPMVGMAAINAVVFGVQGTMMRWFGSTGQTTPLHSIIAGSTAGGVQSLICCPMELVKSRLQVQEDVVGGRHLESPRTSNYTGPWDAVRKIYGAEGIRGLSKGMTITLCREVPAFGLYFGTYDMLCRQLVRDGRSIHDLPTSWLCIAGGLSGVASWIITYPCDFIKSRIQTDGVHGPPQYRGILDCCRKSYALGKLRIFFKGLNATLLRAFPVNGVTFATVAVILKYFRKGEDGR